MQTQIIDDNGHFHDPNAPSFRARLNAGASGDALTDYTIRNLGFIAVAKDRAAARIKLKPDRISPIAFAALMYWLADQRAERVMLSRLEATWQHELLGDGAASAAKLMHVFRESRRPRAGDFLREPAEVNSTDPQNPLLALMRLRDEYGAQLDHARLAPVLNSALGGRFTVIHAAPGHDRLTIEKVGHGLSVEAGYWLQRSVGARVEDAADSDFGAWASAHYREVLKSGVPALDNIDVVVDWPHAGRRRYCYKRLLLPIAAKNNQRGLLCATLQDRSIDLRAGLSI